MMACGLSSLCRAAFGRRGGARCASIIRARFFTQHSSGGGAKDSADESPSPPTVDAPFHFRTLYDSVATEDPPKWSKFPDGSRFWSHTAQGRMQRPIFVAATRQHVGKTTVSLALMSGLKKRFEKVGFLKPVGQQHVNVWSDSSQSTLKVDKDVSLMRTRFQLDHIDYQHMSPVIIPPGYTRQYVDGKISLAQQIQAVEDAMQHVSEASQIVVAEGTGHCAVGSIVGVNNAKIASMIGADMVLVANGGLGSAFDELELNRVLCQHYNVRIAGVIINKVFPDRLEETEHYLRKAMKQSWGIPLLGCIPDKPFLGCPALADLQKLFQAEWMSGEKHAYRHYSPSDVNLVTTSLERFLENLRQKPDRTLYICHITRDDLIFGFLGEYQRRLYDKEAGPSKAALLICGRKDKYPLSPQATEMLQSMATDAPVMVVEYSTHDAMTMLHRFTPKLHSDDKDRVQVAVDHYEPYLNFDELLRRTQASNSSFNEPGSLSLEELRRY